MHLLPIILIVDPRVGVRYSYSTTRPASSRSSREHRYTQRPYCLPQPTNTTTREKIASKQSPTTLDKNLLQPLAHPPVGCTVNCCSSNSKICDGEASKLPNSASSAQP